MNFKKEKNYRLTEINGALVISDAGEGVKDKSAQPLIIADAGRLLTYLDRYFFERERGLTLREAHELAMKTAEITTLISTCADARRIAMPRVPFPKKLK